MLLLAIAMAVHLSRSSRRGGGKRKDCPCKIPYVLKTRLEICDDYWPDAW